MGRKTIPASPMNVAEKQNTALAKRLDELITDTNALKTYLDISAQAINQYRLGISRPSLENLCKIADYTAQQLIICLGGQQQRRSMKILLQRQKLPAFRKRL